MIYGELYNRFNNTKLLSNKIKITDYQTVIGDNFEEIGLEDFLRNLEKNIESNLYDVNYDSEKKYFSIIYDGNQYTLKLNEHTMAEYDIGVYNRLTLRLKRLVDKQANIDNSVEDIEKQNEHYQKLIRIAESGKIPNDEVRLAYINHLEESLKPSLSKIKDYFNNLKKDFIDSKDKTGYNLDNIWPFCAYPLGLCNLVASAIVMCLFLVILIISYVNKLIFLPLLWSLSPLSINLVPGFICLFHQIKSRIKRLKKRNNKRELIKDKIMGLEQLKINNNFKSIGDKMVDSLTSDKVINEPVEVPLKTRVLYDINNIALSLKGIDNVESKKILIRLKEILDYFDKQMQQIDNNSNAGLIILSKENELKCKMNVMINEVQLQVAEILKKDLDKKQLNSEINQTRKTLDSVITYTENGQAYQKRK